MFNSVKLDPFENRSQDPLLRPDWLVDSLSLNPLVVGHITRSAPPAPLAPGVIPPLMMPLTPEETGAVAAAAVAAARGARDDRARTSSSIGIEKYKSGVDDFEDWVELFEKAVNLATRPPNDTERHLLYKEWLSLRLDKPARAILAQAEARTHAVAQALQAPRDATWKELKEELISLLIDPNEEYKWDHHLMTIKWDGIESLQALASRVITAVNKFNKKMDEKYKTKEYFLRFRMALPRVPYQDAIDMACGFKDRSIERAMEFAHRAQIIHANKGDEQKQVTFAAASTAGQYASALVSDQYVAVPGPGVPDSLAAPNRTGAPPSSNQYANASMQDNRTSSLETSLAGINTQLENLNSNMRSYDTRLGSLERDMTGMRSDMSGMKSAVYCNPWNNPNAWSQNHNQSSGHTAPFRPTSPHRPNSPHRSNQPYRPTSPHKQSQSHQTNQPYRPPSPHGSNQQPRPTSPYKQNNQHRSPSPRRSASPGTYPKQSSQGGRGHSGSSKENYRAVDTGDEASESEQDPDVEVARLNEALEKAKARAQAKRQGK